MPTTNPNLLAAMAAADVSAIADAPGKQVLLATPTQWTPRPIVTRSVLNNSAVWGFATTVAFMAALDVVIASGGASGAQASNLKAMLDGAGFDPSDPQTSALVPGFVAMGGGTITAFQGQLAVAVPTYRAGYVPTVDEVSAAMALQTDYQATKAFKALMQSQSLACDVVLSQILDGLSYTVPTVAALGAQ